MIGGGIGAFIGGVHRIAAAMDGEIALVAGAFSSTPEKSMQSGLELGLHPSRCYPNYEEMIKQELELPADQRIDLVSIVTPNHMHFAPAKLAIESGFHVVCDKPLCYDLEQAYALKKVVDSHDTIFALTHNYTGYPMVKQAKAMIKSGHLGKIKKVIVAYPQGWLATLLESTEQKQASWRTDPSKSGVAGAMGDIGTHAENLAEYITGLKITQLCADINIMVEGRKLDDDGNVLLKFDNGANGILYASQIAAGEENDLHIKIYGEKGGLEWRQMAPNSLIVKWPDQPMQTYRTGVGNLAPAAQVAARIPAGHPEGYLEAFANIYKNVAQCIKAKKAKHEVDPVFLDFPSIDDGVRGMEFIYKVIESGKSDIKWLEL